MKTLSDTLRGWKDIYNPTWKESRDKSVPREEQLSCWEVEANHGVLIPISTEVDKDENNDPIGLENLKYTKCNVSD